MTVSVIGAGAFGTGLAISLAGDQDVVLWARSAAQAQIMQERRENPTRLLGARFPDRLSVCHDIERAAQSDVLLLAVPMQKLRDVLQVYAPQVAGKHLVACCKGVELHSGMGPIAVIEDVIPDTRAALLTGPSFAADIAQGLPTALTLACADETCARDLQHALIAPNLRLYRSTDTVGAELGGALKNVIAIACGAIMGAGLGESARAALMTRGYAEMQRMALALGARAETLAGLSGFGDLALTCASDLSRNYRLGLAIGRGEDFDPSVTVEGAATAIAVQERAAKLGIDMPITETVVALNARTLTISQAVAQLLARPLKEE